MSARDFAATMLLAGAAFFAGWQASRFHRLPAAQDYAADLRELACLHRAAAYPVNISAKFAADVCATEPLP